MPWCAALICACLESTGFESTRSARARDFLQWGYSVKDHPLSGAIVVLERGEPALNFGHVGLLMGEFDDSIVVLNGNVNNRICLSQFQKTKVIDYRYPSEPLCRAI